MNAYCVKCRTFRDMQVGAKVTLSNGRTGLQGTCPVCKAKMFRMTKKEASG